jgi:hypothetical protein
VEVIDIDKRRWGLLYGRKFARNFFYNTGAMLMFVATKASVLSTLAIWAFSFQAITGFEFTLPETTKVSLDSAVETLKNLILSDREPSKTSSVLTMEDIKNDVKSFLGR